jgi:hypothetical protein
MAGNGCGCAEDDGDCPQSAPALGTVPTIASIASINDRAPRAMKREYTTGLRATDDGLRDTG